MKHALLLFALASLTFAQARTNGYGGFNFAGDGFVPQFVDGSGWKTIITLVNLDTTAASFTIGFFKDDGTPLSVTTSAGSGTSISVNIPVGGSKTIETPGTNAQLSQGWALVQTSNILAGAAIFRQTVPNRPDFEASMPIFDVFESNRYALPFDHTSPFSTGVAIANVSSSATAIVFIIVRDETGKQLLLDSITLGPFQHTAFNLLDRYAATAQMRGTVEVSTSGTPISALGLRFGAASFTSIVPMVSAKWF